MCIVHCELCIKKMDKLKMKSVDKVGENIERIAMMFPNCVTEVIKGQNEDGSPILERAIDFDMLKQELSSVVVEGAEERYQFTWPDKKKSILLGNSSINKTLRPVVDDEKSPTGTDSKGNPYASTGSCGKDGAVGGMDSENLYIEGDNLDVLKLLQETYMGKVKMIYIDPPYNTGNDFVYEDDFAMSAEDYMGISNQTDDEGNRLFQNNESNGRFHTDWLNMIYPRLKLAKDLLTDDGIIFISIDDNEQANLKKICDEVFGADNFVTNFIWEKKKKPSFLHKNVGKLGEYIICYTKNTEKSKAFSIEKTTEGKKFPFNNAGNGIKTIIFPPKTVKFSISDSIIEPQDMSEGNIVTRLLTKLVVENGVNINQFSLEGEWRYSQEKVNEIIKNGEGIVISKIPFRPNHIKAGGDVKKMKNFLTTAHYNMETNEDATAQMFELFDTDIFDNPKPIKLIKSFINAVTEVKQDIVLDFFSGSATTAHAVMQLNAEDGGNRKFIMVQLPEVTDENSEAYKAGYKNICEIGKERIRRAGKKILKEFSGVSGKELVVSGKGVDNGQSNMFDKDPKTSPYPLNPNNLDIGFRVLKLDSTNMKEVYYRAEEYSQNLLEQLEGNIKPDRTPNDLLFQVMLDMGVLLSSKIEEKNIADKKVFIVGEYAENIKPNLIACFDDNLNDEVVTAIAKLKPLYAVFRDSSFASDSVATNFEQIFTTYSPTTERKVI